MANSECEIFSDFGRLFFKKEGIGEGEICVDNLKRRYDQRCIFIGKLRVLYLVDHLLFEKTKQFSIIHSHGGEIFTNKGKVNNGMWTVCEYF